MKLIESGMPNMCDSHGKWIKGDDSCYPFGNPIDGLDVGTCRALIFSSIADDPSMWDNTGVSDIYKDRKDYYRIFHGLRGVNWKSVVHHARQIMAGSTSHADNELRIHYYIPEDDVDELFSVIPHICIVGAGDGRMALAAEQLGLAVVSYEWRPHSYFLLQSLDKIPYHYGQDCFIDLIMLRADELFDSVHELGPLSWCSVCESLNTQEYETSDLGIRIQLILASLLVEVVHKTSRADIESDAISKAFRSKERGLWRKTIDGYCEFMKANTHSDSYIPMSYAQPLVVNGHEFAHRATCVDLDNKDILVDMRRVRSRDLSSVRYREDLELYNIVLDGVNVSDNVKIILGVHTDVFEMGSFFHRYLDLEINSHIPTNRVPDIRVTAKESPFLSDNSMPYVQRYLNDFRRLVSQWRLSYDKRTIWSLHFSCNTNLVWLEDSETQCCEHTKALFDATGFCFQTPLAFKNSQYIFGRLCEADDNAFNGDLLWSNVSVWRQPQFLEDFGDTDAGRALIRQYCFRGRYGYLEEPNSLVYFFDNLLVSAIRHEHAFTDGGWFVEIKEPLFLKTLHPNTDFDPTEYITNPENEITYWERIWFLVYLLKSDTPDGFFNAVTILSLWGKDTYQHIPKLAILLAGRGDDFSQRFMSVVDQWKFLIDEMDTAEAVH